MANANVKKIYTIDEIKQIAPGYRGKLENFDPSKVENGNPMPKQNQATKTERYEEWPQSMNKSTKPTAQRNDSIISEEIFDVDVIVTEIAPSQSFFANYRKIVDIAADTYDAYLVNEKQIERLITREEISYYATAMLHLRLLEVKAKQKLQRLTSVEREMRKSVKDDEFNVPQPISVYLTEIGAYRDKMGKVTFHEVPDLPVTVLQGFGGYHAHEVNSNTHNLFEEVPSLGIAGDMVMALASHDKEPTPNFHIAKPQHTDFTTSLAGKFFPIGPRRLEIRQRLAGFGITAATFAEYVPGTRFNLKYIRALSDSLGRFETFRIDKITFADKNAVSHGGETQVIKTKPSEIEDVQKWYERNVQATSATKSTTAQMGAACCFGFQLYKGDGPGVKRYERTANWSCITGLGNNPFHMPDDWYNNRNDRQNLPDGIGTERFRAISLRQDLTLSNVTRKYKMYKIFKIGQNDFQEYRLDEGRNANHHN